MKRKGLKDRLKDGQEISKAIINLRECDKKSYYNMLKRVQSILECPYSYFITFTINNENYNLQIDTYRRKIKEALAPASQWVANEDYGYDNGRLHFHALVGFSSQIDYNMILSIYQYGAVNIKPIHTKNAEAIRNYMLKLTLHALKETANSIFYSRQKRRPDYVYNLC